jgi:hypothetical protein
MHERKVADCTSAFADAADSLSSTHLSVVTLAKRIRGRSRPAPAIGPRTPEHGVGKQAGLHTVTR